MRTGMQEINKTEDNILYFVAYSPIRILVSWLINALGIYLVIGTMDLPRFHGQLVKLQV